MAVLIQMNGLILIFFGPVFNQGGFIYSSLLECYKTTHGLNGLNCNDYFEFNY